MMMIIIIIIIGIIIVCAVVVVIIITVYIWLEDVCDISRSSFQSFKTRMTLILKHAGLKCFACKQFTYIHP